MEGTLIQETPVRNAKYYPGGVELSNGGVVGIGIGPRDVIDLRMLPAIADE